MYVMLVTEWLRLTSGRANRRCFRLRTSCSIWNSFLPSRGSTIHWKRHSLASVSMGQEVSVSTLQLAQAGSVFANGGLLVRPRLVLKKGNRAAPEQQAVRAIRPDTAITMRQMMEGVVLYGSGTRARLAGYTVGGKTGSAQIYDFAGKHYTHSYNGSFLGIAPLTNPRVVVVVTLNGTHGGAAGFGGVVAAPVFKVVAAEALRVLDVPKDLPETIPAKMLVAKDEPVGDLADADTREGIPNILEEGEDEDAVAGSVGDHGAGAGGQGPGAGGQGPAAGEQGPAAGERVPNFRGMTMRAVLAEAAARGLTVLPDGSGIARVQSPPPGAPLHEGERIRVEFKQ